MSPGIGESSPDPTVAGLQEQLLLLKAEAVKKEGLEIELRRSQEQLSAYLESASIGLHWVDESGTIVWANAADFESLGYSREEYVGRKITEFHADQAVLEDILTRLTCNEKLVDYEARLLCKDGTQRIVLIDSSVLRENGKFIHTQCFTRDITGQRKAELLNRGLAAIVESSTDGIISKDINGIISTWNRGAERIFGYSAAEIIGKPITVLFPADKIDEEASIKEKILAGRRVEHYEALRRRKDGSFITVSLSISPVRNEAGRIIGASKIVRDVSERKLLETALRESEDRFREMADSAPVFIWMAGPAGAFEYVNKPWLEFSGRSLGQECGVGWTENIHPEDVKKCLDEYAIALQKRIPFRIEFRLKRKDGTYRWMLDSSIPRISSEGVFLGIIGSCIDITELKESEDLFRHSQKMEAVGRLAGGVAHDFNNLLTAINGYADLALGMDAGDVNLPAYLTEIRKSGERAATLTQQLLAYGHKQLRSPKDINLNLVIFQMEKMLRRVIGADIEIRTSLDPKLPSIKADPSQIEQVVLNLIINARDAMPKGGRLSVQTSILELSENQGATHLEAAPGSYVLLGVKDTGMGMSKETMNRIFEPFFTTKEFGKGSGLGLASVYGIVKQSGGGISVESEPGQGSVFKIFFPAYLGAKKTVSEAYSMAPTSPNKRNGTILVAEDEEAVRRLVCAALAGHGFTVLEARDGEDAFSLAGRSGTIDLLVTDIIMPRLNGAELAKKLKPIRENMKVLYMSGYTRDFLEADKAGLSTNNFLQKPFSPMVLIGRVMELLEHSQVANPI